MLTANKLISFNFACLGSFFRFPAGKAVEILIVYYGDFKGQSSIRLPGGSVDFEDVANAILLQISKVDKVYHDRLKAACGYIPDQRTKYEEKVKNIEAEFKERVKSKDSQIAMNAKRDRFFALNKAKNDVLYFILTFLQNSVPLEIITDIAQNARLICMEREVRQEADASEVKGLVQSSSAWVKVHEKCTYVSCDGVVAPDSFSGSGDTDIYASAWKPVSEVAGKFFQAGQSSHENVFQAGIRTALEQKLHPRVEELRQYLTATNV